MVVAHHVHGGDGNIEDLDAKVDDLRQAREAEVGAQTVFGQGSKPTFFVTRLGRTQQGCLLRATKPLACAGNAGRYLRRLMRGPSGRESLPQYQP
jgi:hypothetical protein